jgi:ketosteroid isomerase-like protein
MRTRLALLLLLAAYGCTPASQTAGPQSRAADIETLGLAKVETWRRLYQQQDSAGLNDFLLDDFIVIGPDGSISTKAEEVAWLAENTWSGPDDFVYVIEDIVFQDADIAMVYGHGRATRREPGKPECVETYRSSNLFRRIEGQWRPGFSHLSGVACLSAEEFDKRFATDRSR